MFIGKRPSGEQRGQLVKRDRLVWVGTPSTRLDLTRPLPLVVYPAPSISRTEMRRALNRARLPFRSACVCRGVNGLIGAVAAGIGISAMAASLVPAQLATLGPGHRLPELGTIDLVLLTNPRTDQRPAVRALIVDGAGKRVEIADRLPRRAVTGTRRPRRPFPRLRRAPPPASAPRAGPALSPPSPRPRRRSRPARPGSRLAPSVRVPCSRARAASAPRRASPRASR